MLTSVSGDRFYASGLVLATSAGTEYTAICSIVCLSAFVLHGAAGLWFRYSGRLAELSIQPSSLHLGRSPVLIARIIITDILVSFHWRIKFKLAVIV